MWAPATRLARLRLRQRTFRKSGRPVERVDTNQRDDDPDGFDVLDIRESLFEEPLVAGSGQAGRVRGYAVDGIDHDG